VSQEPVEIHDLAPEVFQRRVHSFEFWFDAVRGYLDGKTFGHSPDPPSVNLEPRERDQLITVLCNYAIGETAALDGASGLVAIAPNREAKLFLATQVADEGRHLEVLIHRLEELGVEDPEHEIQRRASPRLQAFRRRLLELVAGKDWEAAIFAQNVILEAMEFAVFHLHAQDADPVTREVLLGIIKDERRHIGFGENELGRRLKVSPHIRARLSEVKRELDPLVLACFEDVAEEAGLGRDRRPELARNYLAAVARLGFTDG
jgi:1,2-phenylacetyl-CoA epoxidase catalytic subunit